MEVAGSCSVGRGELEVRRHGLFGGCQSFPSRRLRLTGVEATTLACAGVIPIVYVVTRV